MTDTTFDTTTATETVDTWLAAYGEPDRDRRTELVRRVWAADGELIDPPLAGTGHDALVALADAVLEMFPGHTFRRTTDVDGHHRLRPLRLGARRARRRRRPRRPRRRRADARTGSSRRSSASSASRPPGAARAVAPCHTRYGLVSHVRRP